MFGAPHERKLRQMLEDGTLKKETKPKEQAAAEAQTTTDSTAAPTVAEFAEDFITQHCKVEHPRPSSINTFRSILATHVIPTLGPVAVDEIRSKHFGQLKRAMVREREEISGKTINNGLTVLSRMVRFWYEREGLTPPRIKAGLVRIDEPEAEFYEPEDFEVLVQGKARGGRQSRSALACTRCSKPCLAVVAWDMHAVKGARNSAIALISQPDPEVSARPAWHHSGTASTGELKTDS